MSIIDEVRAEVARSIDKHGEQTDVPSFYYGRSLYNVIDSDRAKFLTDHRFGIGRGSWADILLEEVAEAFDEKDNPEALRAELVQVAAVAVSWIEKLDAETVAAPQPLRPPRLDEHESQIDGVRLGPGRIILDDGSTLKVNGLIAGGVAEFDRSVDYIVKVAA